MTAAELETRIHYLTSEIVAVRGVVAAAARKQVEARDALDRADEAMGQVCAKLRDKESERSGLEALLAQLKGTSG